MEIEKQKKQIFFLIDFETQTDSNSETNVLARDLISMNMHHDSTYIYVSTISSHNRNYSRNEKWIRMRSAHRWIAL